MEKQLTYSNEYTSFQSQYIGQPLIFFPFHPAPLSVVTSKQALNPICLLQKPSSDSGRPLRPRSLIYNQVNCKQIITVYFTNTLTMLTRIIKVVFSKELFSQKKFIYNDNRLLLINHHIKKSTIKHMLSSIGVWNYSSLSDSRCVVTFSLSISFHYANNNYKPLKWNMHMARLQYSILYSSYKFVWNS